MVSNHNNIQEQREKAYNELVKEMSSDEYMDGDKDSCKRVDDIKRRIEELDYQRLSPIEKMRREIERQIEDE